MILTLAYLAGVVSGAIPGILFGALIAQQLQEQRRQRRRDQIDLEGSDAIESWIAGMDWSRPHANGTPFPEEDEVA